MRLEKKEIRKVMRSLGLPSSSIWSHRNDVQIVKPKGLNLETLVKKVRKALAEAGVEFRKVTGGRNTATAALVAMVS